mgnify:CR=1 FL=1
MKIKRIWFADDRIYGETDDGRVLWQSLLYYKRLKNATHEQREDYEIDDEAFIGPCWTRMFPLRVLNTKIQNLQAFP